MNKSFLWAVAIIMIMVTALTARADTTVIDFYWSEGCPHCAEEKIFLGDLQEEYPSIEVRDYAIDDAANNERLSSEANRLNMHSAGVPVTIIGDKYFIGFTKGITDSEIVGAIRGEDISTDVAEICLTDADDCAPENVDTSINLPWIGRISLKSLSLPVLTLVLGVVDGFNRCAMWTLIFLLGLLVGIKDARRRWLLGTVFIVASASVYYLLMVAWLNVFIAYSAIGFVRVAIGLVALIAASMQLKDYFSSPAVGCKVTGGNKRTTFLSFVRSVVFRQSLIWALAGIIVLAGAVNIIELACSAGLPAVYTQILAMNNLPWWGYYGYIFLYTLLFMADDLVVFFLSMKALQVTGVTTKYAHTTRLVGGIILAAIGLLIIFWPSLLMFG